MNILRLKFHRTVLIEHLMMFEKEIDGYFPSLSKDKFAYIKNPFIANRQMLHAGTGMQEELVKLQCDGFACGVYSEK